MDEAILVLINAEKLDVPEKPAVYAIFSASKCRYIGATENLKQAITDHFRSDEPNVGLRYFMQSEKPKILQFEMVEKNGNGFRVTQLRDRWIELYNPTDNPKPSLKGKAKSAQTSL
jgi:excinuclease UvrABC nuclease subunit